jgi:hypothetical protein
MPIWNEALLSETSTLVIHFRAELPNKTLSAFNIDLNKCGIESPGLGWPG